MSFSESAHEQDILKVVLTNEQLEAQSQNVTRERVALNNDVATQFPDVPKSAVEYLAVNCQLPEHLPIAIGKVQELLAKDSTALDDPDLAEFELDECLYQAEITAKKDVLETEQTTGKNLDTTIEGLSKESLALQNRLKGNLVGNDKVGQIEQLISDVKAAGEDFPKEQREAALAQLNMIAQTLSRMTTLVDDPTEAEAFKSIVARSNIDLSGASAALAFSDVMAQVDASSEISEPTKTKLRIEGLGVIRNSTDLIAASELARETGQFVNPKTNRVEPFTEKNGMPLGDYTVFPDPKHPNEFVAKAEVGGRTLSVPYSLDDDPAFLNRLIKAAMVGGFLAERDFQGAAREIFGKSNLAAQGYAEIKLDEEQVARAEQLYGAFMGLGTVLSSEFPTEGDLASFKWRLQATHIDGDAKTNDNTGRGDESWKELGMLTNGHLNMTKVGEVGAYLNTKSTALPKFDDLVTRFGDNQPA